MAGAVQYSFSQEGNGKLAYISGSSEILLNKLVWVNRNGQHLDSLGTIDYYKHVNISPNRQKIAVEIIFILSISEK